jgi:glucose/arabinose dehydrogenase
VAGVLAAALAACSGGGSSNPPAASPSTGPAAATTPHPPATGSGAADVVIATGLRSPWGLAFLPNRDVLVGERDSGQIMLLPTDSAASSGYGKPRLLGTVPDVHHAGEGGLLGLAVSPTFTADHLVYAYLTTNTDNRIVRFTLDGGGAGALPRLGTSHPILTGLAAGTFHDGGRIAFGPDGMLYAGVGDATEPSRSQNLGSLNGKILRMRPDGSVPPGNPVPNSLVYSWGHRNVQGLAWDSAGRLWETEFGQNRWDEINLIRPGANYGWPLVEGIGDTQGGKFANPVVTWPVDQASPSGAAIIDDTLYAAALRGQRIWSVDLRPSLDAAPALSTASSGSGSPGAALQVGSPQALRATAYGRLRTLAVAPDGTLWVTTSNTDSRGKPGPDDDRVISLR